MSYSPVLARVASRTDVGAVRYHNEDSYLAHPESGVFAVADGVGGLSGGEVASGKLVEYLEEELKGLENVPRLTRDVYRQFIGFSVQRANAWIRDEAKERGIRAMATTLSLIFFDPDRKGTGISLHAGDSRLYRFREGRITLLTEDHTLASQLGVNEKELPLQMQGVITRAVGIRPEVDLEETVFNVEEGDRILVCSDGLNRMLADDDIRDHLREHDDLDTCVQQLVQAANKAGGYDNITVILISIDGFR